ncbi:ketosteroid isomerase-like protein [Bradyrhizobium sp. AZCC 1578]|uniref:YybH family protein n=1 Tax=Bradyrhizobium sp. AZCC 1578 TaxID=3117027 RepID=UPI002FF0CFC5
MSKKSPMTTGAGSPPALSRRRAIPAMAGLPLAAAQPAAAEDAVAKLIKHSEVSNAALMRGDAETYRAMIAITDDFTLMSPFGGPPSHGSQYTSETWDKVGRFFKNGTHKQEVVQSYGSADMVVLALIERDHVEVGGLPAQEWALRVTLVYRRDGTEWHLVHRHADPLAHGISLQQSAALARGPGMKK